MAPPATGTFHLIIDTPAAQSRRMVLDDHRPHIVLAGLARDKQTWRNIFVSI
jgi:hypothetical protein